MSSIDFSSINKLQTALDRSSLTHNVIAQNIANVDTPNYKEKKVVFGDELASALQAKRTDPRHFEFTNSSSGARVVTEGGSIQNNGNNVDMDKQMTELAQNQIEYQSYADVISREFNKWNIVLGGGNS
ncbi:flagellar basal body rod protein FlgB [Pullulanibacillus camelliae]|uniref:Flagellar basal body rod protein FlgB n=1 Tax=Pullulanibacillus camelliae TaxID=1707096 RepID=A0A8J2YGW7_9BACL|nr:flagellar basal body rod protein FlgB [Pullulanibacillus camelliae]GGE42095.1 flagellar basal body rod protein FlgB [Pullulanibacillus camelliae]